MDNAHELAQGSLAEMRALIFELRPQALEIEGLVSALQKHSDAVRARSGLTVHLEVQGDRRLPIEHEEALYQIAREALHNVVKHAQAGEAWVRLDLSGEEIVLSIEDNGHGFDPDRLAEGGGSHIGTSTMRERAQAIGGTLKIVSAPGHGTMVQARVSVPSGAAGAGEAPVSGADRLAGESAGGRDTAAGAIRRSQGTRTMWRG
jgi:signal transduction histidine kinase